MVSEDKDTSASSLPNKGKDNTPPSKPFEVLHIAFNYLRILGGCFTLYGLGYFQMSSSWLLFGALGYLLYNRAKQKRKIVIEALKAIGKDEKKAILENIGVRELPTWVYFPDVERAEWLNKIIKRMWPYIGDYATELLTETIQPSVDASLPGALRPFKFTHIDLGDTPPRIGGVKVYMDESIKRDEIVMDLDLMLYSDARIKVQVGSIYAGVKEFELRGKMRVVMKPLVSKIPFAGAVTVCFLDNPDINFLLTEMGNILSLPGLQQTLYRTVQDVVSNLLVIPNRWPVQLVPDVELQRLRFPMPQGVVRINIVSGRDLKASDVNVIGKNSSDPYCVVRLGAQKFTTKVCKATLNPTWNEYFEAIVDVKSGQSIQIEVNDQDQGNKDDNIGTAQIMMEAIYRRGSYDAWVDLENVKRGSIHLKLNWLDFSPLSTDFRNKYYGQEEEFYKQFSRSMSRGFIYVMVDRATNLSRNKLNEEPSAYATVQLGRHTRTTEIKQRTNNPVWESVHHFLVQNPDIDVLNVLIRDSKTESKLGECKIPLKILLCEEHMTLTRPFTLQDSSSDMATVHLHLELKALVSGLDRAAEFEAEDETALLKTESNDLMNEIKKDIQQSKNSNAQVLDQGETEVRKRNVADVKSELPSSKLTTEDQGAKHKEVVLDKHDHSSLGKARPDADVEAIEKPANSRGLIEITGHYCDRSSSLGVIIHQCKDLMGVDKDGLSDPYVKVYITYRNGEEKGEKQKTRTIKDTLAPEFEERFDFTLEPEDVENCILNIDVKNHVGRFSRNGNVHYIGSVRIPLNNVGLQSGYREWHYLQLTNEGDGQSVRSD